MSESLPPRLRQPSGATGPSAGGSLRALREGNLQRILELLGRHGGMTQAEMARRTALSAATVSNLVADLRRRGMVQLAPPESRGRRGLTVLLERPSGVVLGIDFGHRHLRVAVADLAHTVLAEDRQSMPEDLSAAKSISMAMATAGRLVAEAGTHLHDVLMVGVGLPGPIDPASGRIGSSAILPGWAGREARTILEEALGVPVVVDNDANLGALAEHQLGAGEGCADLAYLKLSTGVGAGLILGGRLYRGAAGTAGEIGHTTIDEHGHVCRCGNRGCLETMVGAHAILELLRRSHGDALTMQDVLELANSGDTGCRRILADAGRFVGIAVANLCNLLSPQRVVVGGDLALAGEVMLGPLRQAVARRAVPAAAEAAQILPGVLGERAEVLGAVTLALSSLGFGAAAQPQILRLAGAST